MRQGEIAGPLPNNKMGWMNEIGEATLASYLFFGCQGTHLGGAMLDIIDGPTDSTADGPAPVDLIKLVHLDTGDRPFYASLGEVQVAAALAMRGSVFLDPENGTLIATKAFLAHPGNQWEPLPLGAEARYVDSTLDSEISRTIRDCGVANFRNPDVKITKRDTKSIAERAGVKYPRRWDSVYFASIQGTDTEEILGQEVVIKPYEGCQGDNIVFHKVTDTEELGQLVARTEYEKGYVIEERIVPPTLVIEDRHGNKVEHDWNIRAVVINGLVTNYYCRVSAMGGPVNISTGSFHMSMGEVTERLGSIGDLPAVDAKIVEFGQKIGALYPNQVLGIDIIIGEDGELYLIEVNDGNINCMGEPDRDYIFSPEEINLARERQTKAYLNVTYPPINPSQSGGLVNLFPELTKTDFYASIIEIVGAMARDRAIGFTMIVDLLESLRFNLEQGRISQYLFDNITDAIGGYLEDKPPITPDGRKENITQILMDELLARRTLETEETEPASISEVNPAQLLKDLYYARNPLKAAWAVSRILSMQPCHTLLEDGAKNAATYYLDLYHAKIKRKRDGDELVDLVGKAIVDTGAGILADLSDIADVDLRVEIEGHFAKLALAQEIVDVATLKDYESLLALINEAKESS